MGRHEAPPAQILPIHHGRTFDHGTGWQTCDGRVVHLLGRVTQDSVRLLGPATAALSQSRIRQTVVYIDDPMTRGMLPDFADTVELVRVPLHQSILEQWRGVRAAYRSALDTQGLAAVHLHGFVASLVAQRVLHRLGTDVPVFYSPHGSRSLESLRFVATVARALARPYIGTSTIHAIANGACEAKDLRSLSRQPVRLLEHPVSDAFIGVSGRQQKDPLIVTANRSTHARGVELFAQLAVLLGGDPLRIGFQWLGTVDPVSQTRLQAANVDVLDAGTDAERAARMSAAWVFVALADGRGFPYSLVEAMAVGLPCVAVDTPAHRDVVQHGETGYLCRNRGEVIDRIAQLIDTPSLRRRMGLAAAAEAGERFSKRTFVGALHAAYDIREPDPAASAGGKATSDLEFEGFR